MTYQIIRKWVAIGIFTLLLLSYIMMFLGYFSQAIILYVVIVILFLYYRSKRNILETTLCLIVKNDKVLMMLRNKKKGDVHLNKYNGLGGKVERNETHVACVKREVFEEAGIILKDYHYVGKIKFQNFIGNIGDEIMYAYCAYDYDNELGDCNEGELVWVPKQKVLKLPLWEGDKYFLMNIIENRPFKAVIRYDGEKVVSHEVKEKNGNKNSR